MLTGGRRPHRMVSWMMLIGASISLAPGRTRADATAADELADEVIVTATRTDIKMDLAPASATVLSQAILDTRTFDSIDEALNYEAGVYDGRMRGTSSTSHTLVMLNGMPLNSGWYGGIRWENIAMENVERIEIVRGPGSALYGGNAMGGTINIITKLPQDFEANLKVRAGSDDNLRYGGSIGDKWGERLAVRLGAEYDVEMVGRPIDYVFRPVTSGSGTLTGGESSLNRTGSPYWIVGDKGERNESQWNVNVAVSYELSDAGTIRLEAQEGYADYANGRPNSYVVDASGNLAYSGSVNAGAGLRATITPNLFLNGEGVDRNSAYMLTYSDQLGAVGLISKFGYQNEDKWYTSVTGSGDYDTAAGNVREFDTDTYFVDLQGNIDVGGFNTLTAGLYFRKNTFDQGQYNIRYYRDENSKIGGKTELTQGTDDYYAVYLQDEISFGHGLTAYVGGRYDTWKAHDGLSGATSAPIVLADTKNSAFSPSASLVWEISNDTVLRAAVAKAFSAPTLYDLYRTYQSGSTLILGNPDLKSETLINYELGGVQYLFDRRVRFGLTGYQMDYDDLVYGTRYDDVNDIDNNPNTTEVSTNANAGKARNRGYEITLDFKPAEWLNLWANYARNHTKILSNTLAPEAVGKEFTYSPERTANAGMNMSHDWFSASLNGNYTGRIYRTADNSDVVNDVYQTETIGWLWDFKLTADVPLKKFGMQSVTVSLSVKNLLDKEYFDYYIGQSRSYYGELSVKF